MVAQTYRIDDRIDVRVVARMNDARICNHSRVKDRERMGQEEADCRDQSLGYKLLHEVHNVV